nr:hypothetical protein [Tanacetum cinerariifolium]
MGQDRQMQMVRGMANQNGNRNVVATRAEGNGNGNNGNQIRDIHEIEEVNANYILMANLQQASTSAEFYPRALLHKYIAQAMRERPLNELFEK